MRGAPVLQTVSTIRPPYLLLRCLPAMGLSGSVSSSALHVLPALAGARWSHDMAVSARRMGDRVK